MGRIKTAKIKRVTNQLMDRYGDDFKMEFSDNKKLVSQRADIQGKKMRNVIAGYVTRLKKSHKKK